MKTTTISSSCPIFRVIAIGLVSLLAGAGLQQAAAQAPLGVAGAGLVGGKVMMNWTSNSYSYEVQTTESIMAPNWRPVLATSRTNGMIPLNGSSGFFRVVGPKPNGINLLMHMTNLADNSSVTMTLQAQTNLDLVFNSTTNWNGFDHYRIVYPADQLQNFDVSFDDAGGFTLVPYNGAPVTSGGWWTISNGPETNNLTYSGFLTNSGGMYKFFERHQPFSCKGSIGAGQSGNPFAGISGTVTQGVAAAGQATDTTTCAGEWLGCQGTCFTKGVACAFFGKGVDCGWTQNIQWQWVYSTNILGVSSNWLNVCNGHCDPQCK